LMRFTVCLYIFFIYRARHNDLSHFACPAVGKAHTILWFWAFYVFWAFMEKYTFQIQDEFTYWRIIGFLDENKIEYACRKIESSLFPSFHHGGEIEVFAQDVPTVEELLRGEEDSPTESNVYKSATQALPTQSTQSGTIWNKWRYWLFGH
jgi:hypothetical protein